MNDFLLSNDRAPFLLNLAFLLVLGSTADSPDFYPPKFTHTPFSVGGNVWLIPDSSVVVLLY